MTLKPPEMVCDDMIVHGLHAMGHRLSDQCLYDLFRILNLNEFRSNFLEKKISTSFARLKKTELQIIEEEWSEQKNHNSVVFVRDLKKVLLDMWADVALWNSFDFEGTDFLDLDEKGYKWSHRWTSFDLYQSRREAMRKKFGDVDLLSFGLWLDSGELESGQTIYILVLFPLNAPSSLIRRGDCVFPIGYVYQQSDIVDCFEVLLPQFECLRDVPRSFPGRIRSIVCEID